MLTGLQYSILSRIFFLQIGRTVATFASFEKELLRDHYLYCSSNENRQYLLIALLFWVEFYLDLLLFRICVLDNLIYIFYFCSRNFKSSCCKINVVFDVYNAIVIFTLFNDIFYSSVVLIRIVRVSLDDWWYTDVFSTILIQ